MANITKIANGSNTTYKYQASAFFYKNQKEMNRRFYNFAAFKPVDITVNNPCEPPKPGVYLITGKIDSKNELYADSCDWSENYNKMSPATRKSFENGFTCTKNSKPANQVAA